MASDNLLRKERLPYIWCPGCGNATILAMITKALEKTGWKQDEMMAVSGIGCSSRATGYLNMNTLHTLHGRALPFATGVKMANPKLNTLVITGDGDGTAIGGNHFIHAARRNIDLTVILFNNNIYGMTGGQYSPTTPIGFQAKTAKYGNAEHPFCLVDLAIGAGASFVARTTVGNPKEITDFVYAGFMNKGFSFIEVVCNCHEQFGRINKMRRPIDVIKWIKDKTITIEESKQFGEEELEHKIVTGIFKNAPRAEYISVYDEQIMNKAMKSKE